MKKKIILGMVMPLAITISSMPIALTSCSQNGGSEETETTGNVTIQTSQKTQKITGGSSTATISATLKSEITADQKLDVTLVTSNSNSAVSAKLNSFEVKNLTVKANISLSTTSEYGLQNGDYASFAIKYVVTDTTTSSTVWESKVENCKLTYTSPISISSLDLYTNSDETTVSSSLTLSTDTTGSISIYSQSSEKARVTLNKTSFSATSNTFSLTMSSKTSTDLVGGETVSFALKFATSTWTQIIPNFTATYISEGVIYIPNSCMNISGSTLSGLTGTYPTTCTTLKIPSTITKISANAFKNEFGSGSQIKTIIIPSSVTEIESNAFYGCSGITKLVMNEWTSTPEWTGKDIFSGWASTGTLTASSTANKILICDYIYDKLPGLWTANDYMETYIKDRTFTIGALNSDGYACIGTGWIVSDATPLDTSDYTYYVATNWHVTHGMASIVSTGGSYSYLYGDYSLADSSTKIVDIYDYWKMDYTLPTDSDFMYTDRTQTTYRKDCIDFQITKIKFGSKSSASSDPTGSIKTKLDKLNKKNVKDGYITDFTDVGADISTKSTWIGGYPGKETATQWGGQWETHKMSAGIYDFDDIDETTTTSYVGNPEVGHSIGYPDYDQTGAYQGDQYPSSVTPEKFYNYDTSPQYSFNYSVATTWMDGGSSGSMLITQDYKICAIYWGGWGGTAFWPAFSIFRSSYKDFLTGYWSKS